MGSLGLFAIAHRRGLRKRRSDVEGVVRRFLRSGLGVTADVLEEFWASLGGSPRGGGIERGSARSGYKPHGIPRSPDARLPATVPAMVEAYCVKCKQKREMKNPEKVTMANGRAATKGTCPVCGTSLFKIGGG